MSGPPLVPKPPETSRPRRNGRLRHPSRRQDPNGAVREGAILLKPVDDAEWYNLSTALRYASDRAQNDRLQKSCRLGRIVLCHPDDAWKRSTAPASEDAHMLQAQVAGHLRSLGVTRSIQGGSQWTGFVLWPNDQSNRQHTTGRGGQGTWASQKHSEAGYGRPVDRGVWTAKTVKRPRQQPAHPQYANYWAPLTRKRHTIPHSAQPRHTNYWAPRTRKRHQQKHRPQRPTEHSDPTQHAKGRKGDRPGPRKGATTRRNVTQGAGTVYPSSSRFTQSSVLAVAVPMAS